MSLEINKIYNEDCIGDNGMCLIPDKSIDMILCDLPYTFKGKNRVTANRWDLPIDDSLLWENYLRIIKDNGAIVLTATNPFASYLIYNHLEYFKYDWVWEKDNGSNFVHVKTQPFKVHEMVLVFGKAPTTFNKNNFNLKYNPQFTYSKPYTMKRDGSDVTNLSGFGGRTNTINEDGKRYPRTVQKFNLERGLHPTQKPVALFEYLIKTYTNEGETILDNCIGSGTTAISAINTNRNYIGFELDENYYNIANDRINKALIEKQNEQTII
jgi:site-specific DNA-methyltransferase (adenine-specific)